MFRSFTSAVLRNSNKVAIPSRAFNLREFSAGTDAGSKLTGAVKWFDGKKGYGFIVPSDGSEDVFVHHSSIYAKGYRSLQDGEYVEFNLGVEDSGRRVATDVTGPFGAFVQGKQLKFRRDNRGDRQYYNDGDSE